MTVDKTALKKMIDTARPNELMVATVSSLDKDAQKKIRSELDKFISKGGDCFVVILKR